MAQHSSVHLRRGVYIEDLGFPPFSLNNNNNKRPLTPKSMPPAGDEHAKLKTLFP